MKINEKCECTPCPDCNGTGTVWFSFSGKCLGNHRCDDLDEWESCERCDGHGIDSVCLKCQLEYEDEQEQEGAK